MYNFCREARDAITRRAFDELAYGCFAICLRAIRLRHDLEEIAPHATGFRLAVLQLMKTPQAPSGEEMFFIECLWEKLVWAMCEQLLFEASPTREAFETLTSFVQPLRLSTYQQHPRWMRNSFKLLTLKFQFLQTVAALHRSAIVDACKLKHILVARFKKGCSALRGETNPDTSLVCALSLELWSSLFDLIQDSDAASQLSNGLQRSSRTVAEIVYSLHYLVSCIPEAKDGDLLTVGLFQLYKLSIECLSFAGLLTAGQQSDDLQGLSRLTRLTFSS